jgi:HlyD family secretion protein
MKLKLSSGKRRLLILISLATAIAAGIWLRGSRRTVAVEFGTERVERGGIRHTVTTTGTLQAVATVQIGSEASGTISELYADFNSRVHKGQVIAQLKPNIFQAQVESARANLSAAQASMADAQARKLAAQSTIQNQRAGVIGAAANVAALKVQYDNAQNALRRQDYRLACHSETFPGKRHNLRASCFVSPSTKASFVSASDS